MGGRLSGFGRALYDSKRREFLGRDGGRWAKLSVFYFFFYLGLAGFFCAMLAVFMALSPRDRPRYYSEDSRMRTRSNPLSPGLGFRPQPEVDKNIIVVNRDLGNTDDNPYVKNLDQYLSVYYWNDGKVARQQNADAKYEQISDKSSEIRKFRINNPGECTSDRKYGFGQGRPCVLVKMNKIVGFEPIPGYHESEEKDAYEGCQSGSNAIPVRCYGEYAADVDNIGNITYISERGSTGKCGALETSWFPYEGKYGRTDLYQAPYVWVQFTSPKRNVLINVICRVYGENMEFDKKAGRALTRFQLYVKDLQNIAPSSSRKGGDM